jgi:hypothetical protein
VELPNGKSTSVKKLMDKLTVFINNLTALRVGIEFISNLDLNIFLKDHFEGEILELYDIIKKNKGEE